MNWPELTNKTPNPSHEIETNLKQLWSPTFQTNPMFKDEIAKIKLIKNNKKNPSQSELTC
jgi:hypothetical protein